MDLRDSPEEAAFRARFDQLWLGAVYQNVPVLRQFASDNPERLIQKFADLDRRAIAGAPERVRFRLLQGAGRIGHDGDDAQARPPY